MPFQNNISIQTTKLFYKTKVYAEFSKSNLVKTSRK